MSKELYIELVEKIEASEECENMTPEEAYEYASEKAMDRLGDYIADLGWRSS